MPRRRTQAVPERDERGLILMARVTTNIPGEQYNYVVRHRLEFGSLLSLAIRSLMEKDAARAIEEATPAPLRALKEWLGARNRSGIATSEEQMSAKKAELGIS